jgi:hypothetical protein
MTMKGNPFKIPFFDLLNAYDHDFFEIFEADDHNTIHGHHIIYQLGAAAGAAKDEARDARDILLYYGINPYWDRENLAYAPNHGHPKEAIIYRRDQLRDAVEKGRARQYIVEMLRDFAERYIDKKLPGFPDQQGN